MSSDRGHPGHFGVQLVASLLARSTTQTAIVLGAGMGRVPPAKQGATASEAEPLLRLYAAAEMFGVLRTTLVGINVVDVGNENRAEAGKLKRQFNGWIGGDHPDGGLREIAKAVRDDDSLKVDVVVTPIDGAGALKDGLSGSVSIVAAGRTGCFAPNDDQASQDYIAIAIPKSALTPDVISYLTTMTNDQVGNSALELLGNFGHLERIIGLLPGNRGIPPVVAITVKDGADQVDIKAWHRRRILEGSVVAGGLTAYLGKVDCSLVFTKRSQLTQLAVACKALGGRLVAFPLRKLKRVTDKERRSLRSFVVTDDALIREDDLVLQNNAILCVTSVSEVCILDRVRYDPGVETVSTDSILVSLATGGVIRQTDKFMLNTANARDADGKEVKLGQRIRDVWQRSVSGSGG